uniref:Uncharacterized protein n=1 Tax=Rhizophora mucronata TaxID=61149 RepID=A0A2P2PCK9_RHIMU
MRKDKSGRPTYFA